MARSTPVHRSLNQPLTLCGIERGLFVVVISGSWFVWILTDSLLVSALVAVPIYVQARAWTRKDPKFLPILCDHLLNTHYHGEYDGARFKEAGVVVLDGEGRRA